MQASDVTDRWLLVVQEIWCVGPLKRWAAQGIIRQAWNCKGGNVLIPSLGDTDTASSHRGSRAPPHRHSAAAISLTCQREARCGFVFNCHILFQSGCCSYVWPPLVHQVCFTFYLMNCTHEVIPRLQQSSLKLFFFFFFFFFLVEDVPCSWADIFIRGPLIK